MRRTQPDFSSVLPTVVLPCLLEWDSFGETEESLGGEEPSKRRDRLRLLSS